MGGSSVSVCVSICESAKRTHHNTPTHLSLSLPLTAQGHQIYTYSKALEHSPSAKNNWFVWEQHFIRFHKTLTSRTIKFWSNQFKDSCDVLPPFHRGYLYLGNQLVPVKIYASTLLLCLSKLIICPRDIVVFSNAYHIPRGVYVLTWFFFFI